MKDVGLDRWFPVAVILDSTVCTVYPGHPQSSFSSFFCYGSLCYYLAVTECLIITSAYRRCKEKVISSRLQTCPSLLPCKLLELLEAMIIALMVCTTFIPIYPSCPTHILKGRKGNQPDHSSSIGHRIQQAHTAPKATIPGPGNQPYRILEK